MNIDYIKTILFITAAVFPILLIIKKSLIHYRNFIYTILFIHLVLILIITLKLHHLLRDKFDIPNTITYIIGAIPFLILFSKYKAELIVKEIFYLAASIILLASAALIDLVSDGKILNIPDNDFIEEIFHIAGAFVWLAFNYLLYSRLKKI